MTSFESTLKGLGLMVSIPLFLSYSVNGQNSMGIGTNTPNQNAVLELVSPANNQGFLVPRLTTVQRTTIGGGLGGR